MGDVKKETVSLVPQTMRMDGNAAKAINFMLGSADADDDTPLDAILWVGDLAWDDGAPVHGLHLANAEYPEEGSITLVEFAAPSSPTVGELEVVARHDRVAPVPVPVTITPEMVERAAKATFEEGSVVSWETAHELARTDPASVYGSVIGSFLRAANIALTAALSAKPSGEE